MARRFATRREMEEHRFPPAVTIGAPLLALFLSAYLPKLVPVSAIVDWPLIVVVYFSIARRSPIAGTLTGAVTGLLQDTLSNQYIGVNGIAKSIIGYIGASMGLKIDVDNAVTRALLNFAFSLLHSVILLLVEKVLLASHGAGMLWTHELIRAVVNAVVALPVFLLLDQLRSDS